MKWDMTHEHDVSTWSAMLLCNVRVLTVGMGREWEHDGTSERVLCSWDSVRELLVVAMPMTVSRQTY
ncbi:hypothetical protein BCR34DRAFT_327785 [Clohesyomyces aquaticus]|uniref:Uncharacterized protein n=1 Tax=Clohesyomyces aquaticus TaxID=1231657 RepID=A0A1Y1ZM92_9PLEO|nr:hypothetical protein BCR34DRAFT_327785 [Clohesyomyces aquaticus]